MLRAVRRTTKSTKIWPPARRAAASTARSCRLTARSFTERRPLPFSPPPEVCQKDDAVFRSRRPRVGGNNFDDSALRVKRAKLALHPPVRDAGRVDRQALDDATGGRAGGRPRVAAVFAAGAVPLVVLGVLLSAPHLDGHWQNNSAHFWIVLIAGLVSTTLGYAVREAALRRHDARLFLVSLGFIASAGFLALHALATPGVVVGGKNAGFVIAPPVGLLIAGVFVAASAFDLSSAAGAAVMRHARLLTGTVLALIAAWGVVSVAELPPLSHSLKVDDARVPLAVVAGIGVLFYAFAAAGYYRLYRQRHARLVFAVSFAFAILAEASIVVVAALATSWRISWWEWHILMLLRSEERRV